VPAPERPKDTVPVGADAVPLAVSSTTALQVEAWFKATVAGVQVTVVAVDLTAGVSVRFFVNGEPVHVPLLVQVTVALEPASVV
jgi:hypothetical protein